MNPSLVLLLVGCSFIAVFGGLALLRREGLSIRFALEGLAITALFVGLSLAGLFSLYPVFLLAILYLVTMRVRLLVDLARLLRNVVRPVRLLPFYELALRLGPDAAGRVITQIDRGATLLRAGRTELAAAALEDALAHRPPRHFNPRYEATCRYNLGMAHRRLGEESRAAAEFNQVIDLLPGTLYARMCERALSARGKEAAGQPTSPESPPEGRNPPGDKEET